MYDTISAQAMDVSMNSKNKKGIRARCLSSKWWMGSPWDKLK